MTIKIGKAAIVAKNKSISFIKGTATKTGSIFTEMLMTAMQTLGKNPYAGSNGVRDLLPDGGKAQRNTSLAEQLLKSKGEGFDYNKEAKKAYNKRGPLSHK